MKINNIFVIALSPYKRDKCLSILTGKLIGWIPQRKTPDAGINPYVLRFPAVFLLKCTA